MSVGMTRERTGVPTYLVEVRVGPGLVRDKRDDYLKAQEAIPPEDITRVLEMTKRGNNVVARDIGPMPSMTAPQEVEPEGGFYSGVAKILNRKMPNAAPPQQVKAIIKDAPQEDVKWSGVTQAIDQIASENKGKVPKGALLDHLQNEGAVKFQEVTLEEMSGERYAELQGKGRRFTTFVIVVDKSALLRRTVALMHSTGSLNPRFPASTLVT